MNFEQISMMIIAYSGAAKSAALSAITAAEEKQDSNKLFEEAEENLRLAGQEHFKALEASTKEEAKIDILFIHAEDQMMNAETTLALAKKIVKVYEKINE